MSLVRSCFLWKIRKLRHVIIMVPHMNDVHTLRQACSVGSDTLCLGTRWRRHGFYYFYQLIVWKVLLLWGY